MSVSRSIRVFCLAVAALCMASCGTNDDPTNPNDRLCGGEAGLGARIEGRSSPVQFCLDDGDVSVVLTSADRYDVAGQMTTAAGTFQIHMVFAQRADVPVTLTPAATLDDALADPGKVWVYYSEIPDGGDAIESVAPTGGTFRLTFGNDKVITGTLNNIVFDMTKISNGDPAPARTISEGFLSLSVKSPAAAVLQASR